MGRVFLLLALLLGSCTTGAGTPPAPVPSCQTPPESDLPDASGALDETSTGSYCLQAGALVDVFLHAEDPRSPWSEITATDKSVVTGVPMRILTPPVGVRVGRFQGVKAGQTTLTSSLSGGRKWTVTVVVLEKASK